MHKVSRTIKRRRKEGKTDYKLRLGLLKSSEPRVVFRKTNRYVIGQIVSSEVAQDKILFGVSSKDLLSHGWPKDSEGSLKNIQACYLTGYLLGKKSKGIKKAIFDFGLQRNIHKGRIYAFLKGVIDSGLHVAHNKDALPSNERIMEHEKLGKIVEKVKGGIK
jgi:large subunit ribosomal protein L18